MNFGDFAQWAFYGLVGGSVVYGVSILAHLKGSIDLLNEKIAVVIEKTTWHEKMIKQNQDEINDLKKSFFSKHSL